MNWFGEYWRQALGRKRFMTKIACQLSLGMISLLLLSWLGWQEVKAQGADWLPIKYVRIEGAFQYISKEKMKQVITGHVMNGLINADVQQIGQSVKQLPWVYKVKVKRIWPDAINIKIIEQVPVVRWGNRGLLNIKGQRFMPENINVFNQLPLLDVPVGIEKILLSEMREMSGALMKQDLVLTDFIVDERRAWKLALDNKMEIKLGKNEPKKKFNRFLKTLALIGEEQVKKISVVDLRYANGYALTWKQGEEKIDWEKVAAMNKT